MALDETGKMFISCGAVDVFERVREDHPDKDDQYIVDRVVDGFFQMLEESKDVAKKFMVDGDRTEAENVIRNTLKQYLEEKEKVRKLLN